jgi:transposase
LLWSRADIIRTHIAKRLEMEEAKLYVVEEVRFTYGCSDCHDGSQMQTTERPPQAVEKSPFGPSILAWLVTWKFLHDLPVYRQQELLLGPLERWLSRALLCGLLSRTAQALRPLERLIHERVLASIVINADETEVKMLKPGNGRAITRYLSGYAGDADHRYVFYDFRPSRSRDGPKEVLADYRGCLQTDATSSTLHSCARRQAALYTLPAGHTVGGASRKQFRRLAILWSTRLWSGRSSSTTSKTVRRRCRRKIAGHCARPKHYRSWRG